MKKMKNVTLDFYFEYSNENMSNILDYISLGNFGFTPNQMIIDDDYDFIKGVEQLKYLNSDDLQSLSLIINEVGDNPNCKIHLITKKWSSRILLNFCLKVNLSSEEDYGKYEHILKFGGLICAFYYDTLDEKWQTENRIKYFKLEGFDTSGLPFTKNTIGETVIDTSGNFGRSKFCIGIKIVAASRMFFGPLFYYLISKEKISQFSNSINQALHEYQIVEIKLFSVFKDDINLIRSKQKHFLDQTKLFQIIETLNQKHFGIKNMLNDIGIF